jgi:hypothetical protein
MLALPPLEWEGAGQYGPGGGQCSAPAYINAYRKSELPVVNYVEINIFKSLLKGLPIFPDAL